MPAKSLKDLSFRRCQRSIRSLKSVGTFPYSLVRPVLFCVDNPTQLREIELASPHILGEDAELWERLIARDEPNWKAKNYVPKNPQRWHAVYKRYMREQKEAVEIARAELLAKFSTQSRAREGKTVQLVEAKNLPKLPKESRMVGRDGVLIRGRGNGDGGWKAGDMRFTEGSRTKMANGKDVMVRARREAKEMSRMNQLRVPTGQLGLRNTGVTRAPQGLIEEKRREKAPSYLPAASERTPQTPFDNARNEAKVAKPGLLDEREARLRAMQKGYESRNMIDISDEEDISEDDLFGERMAKQTASRSSPMVATKVETALNKGMPTSSAAPNRFKKRPLQTGRDASPGPPTKARAIVARSSGGSGKPRMVRLEEPTTVVVTRKPNDARPSAATTPSSAEPLRRSATPPQVQHFHAGTVQTQRYIRERAKASPLMQPKRRC